MKLRGQQFVLGVAAGLAAQAISALWHWLRAPALPLPRPAPVAGKPYDSDRRRTRRRRDGRACPWPAWRRSFRRGCARRSPSACGWTVPEVRADDGLRRRAGGGAGEAARGRRRSASEPRTGRALLLFAAPVDDLGAVLGAVVSAAENAAPLDEDAAHAPGAGGGAGAAGLATVTPPGQWDWLRVLAGGVAVAALTVVRLFGGPLALVSPPVAILATGRRLAGGNPHLRQRPAPPAGAAPAGDRHPHHHRHLRLPAPGRGRHRAGGGVADRPGRSWWRS